jgi:hypothetical protein
MESLTVRASSLEVAEGLSGALSRFHPEITGGSEEGYQVSVSLVDSDVIAILNALERHVRERQAPARVEVDGRGYLAQPEYQLVRSRGVGGCSCES